MNSINIKSFVAREETEQQQKQKKTEKELLKIDNFFLLLTDTNINMHINVYLDNFSISMFSCGFFFFFDTTKWWKIYKWMTDCAVLLFLLFIYELSSTNHSVSNVFIN